MSSSPIAFAGKELGELALPHRISVDANTGALVASVSLPVTPARNGFQPSLSLAYSSSAPNSTFGLGWSLSGVPSVTLNTRRGLPRYDGSDTHSFGGAELVPVVDDRGRPRVFERGEFWVHVFRARYDTAFTRFEKWIEKRTGREHFRIRDRAGSVSVFGRRADGTSRISDPRDGSRTFEWLLEWQVEPDGNAIHYDYVAENAENLTWSAFELGRLRRAEFAQRYLRRIRYGNRTPLDAESSDADVESVQWLFSVVLDYGERGADSLPYTPTRAWALRPDPISHYRAGFEVRSYRLCRKFLVFHHFPDVLGEPSTLVGVLALSHREDAAGSTLESVQYTGHRPDQLPRSVPPLRFRYSQGEIDREFRNAPRTTVENVPAGFAGSRYRMVDLRGDGLPGILVDDAQAWYYKENLGGGSFGPQSRILAKPAFEVGRHTLEDFDGDGNPNLVVLEGNEAGQYEYDRARGEWSGFRPFSATPRSRSPSAHTKLLDLDGDGRSDIVTVEPERVIWHKSKGRDGFEPAVELSRPHERDDAPTIGANALLDLFFADMTGDGLPDQVRVRNGRIEYWPQLGNGRFGERVLMEGAPILDRDDSFNPSRVLLVDLDGSGTSDLVYVGRGEIRFWRNANGNRWVEGGRIGGLPYIDDLDGLAIVDFLGNGTSCLVWSTPRATGEASSLRYLRLTGAERPRLLVGVDNSMGRETTIQFGHSARHYLRDVSTGRGWNTLLPNHTVVVDRVEVHDHIGGTRTSSSYEYHDGYFDSAERLFRGFGLVDRFDTDVRVATDLGPDEQNTEPACTRTWFHNGAVGSEPLRATDYYEGDELATSLRGHSVDDLGTVSADEYVDGFRALAGQVVRTEVYGVEPNGRRRIHPYQVSQARFRIRRLSRAHANTGAAFTHFQSEALTHVYEQDPSDPRVKHDITHRVDAFGSSLLSTQIAYPRRHPSDVIAQRRLHVSVTENTWFNRDEPDRYLLGVPVESRGYEVRDVTAAAVGSEGVLDATALERELGVLIQPSRRLRFDQASTGEAAARLSSWQRVLYWNDSQSDVLPLGQVGTHAHPHHDESAAHPVGMLQAALGARISSELLQTEGLYSLADEHHWQSSAIRHYDTPRRFHLLVRESRRQWQDGAFAEVSASYEFDDYLLALIGVVDPLGVRTARARIDYVRCAPDRITDANDNVQEVRYDPLGVVIATTDYGRILGSDGREQAIGNDPLERHALVEAEGDVILGSPERFLQGASTFFHYRLDGWTTGSRRPPFSITLARSERLHDGEGGSSPDMLQIQLRYFDGFGRPLQVKERVGEGTAVHRDPDGRLVLDGDTIFQERWRVSSHTVYNDKQEITRNYEPFFSVTSEFESDQELRTFGESTVTTYDAVGRDVRALYPNLTVSRTEHRAWEIRRSDPNDAVAGTMYATLRQDYLEDHPERLALESALAHVDTPSIAHLDPLGRPVVSVVEGGTDGSRRTETVLDHQGNPSEYRDPRDLRAFMYRRDMLGRSFHETSVDAGERWSLIDAENRPIHVWDGRGAHERIQYDALGRPTSVHVEGLGVDHVSERMLYGDAPDVPDAALRNLSGRLYVHHDAAGVQRVDRYDPSGVELEVTRTLAKDYRTPPDWRTPESIELESESFATLSQVDAMGRLTRQRLPDGTDRRFEYQAGGGIERVLVSTADGALVEQEVLADASYNARGQRVRARIGPARVDYEYEPATYRLARVRARRHEGEGPVPPDARVYRDVRYAYDPAGNLVYLSDAARSDAASVYHYDAFYQLRSATGRVHRALEEDDYDPARRRPPEIVKGTRQISLDDLTQLRRYTREYRYDSAGNLEQMRHTTHARLGTMDDRDRSWVRDHWISTRSNRSLVALDLAGVPISDSDAEARFDENGNVVRLPHLRSLEWNHRNQLTRSVRVSRTGSGERDDAEYYVHASNGIRVRKVDETLEHGLVVVREKLYLGGCELVRTRRGGELQLSRHVSHLGDGSVRLATLHQWNVDTLHTETDDVTQKKLHFNLTNHLGSSTLEVDATGDVITYEEYFPYGGSAFIAGRSLRDVSLKDYRYSGKECDEATGFYYYGQRYYAPWLARWLNPDPSGPEDGLNLYRFVRGNPICFVDPTGLETWVQVDIVRIDRATRRAVSERTGEEPWAPGVLHAFARPAEDAPPGESGTRGVPSQTLFNMAATQPEGERTLYVYDPRREYLRVGTQEHGSATLRVSRNERTGELEYFVLVPDPPAADADPESSGDADHTAVSGTGTDPESTSAAAGAGGEGTAPGEGEGRAGTGSDSGEGPVPGGDPAGTAIHPHTGTPEESDRLTMDVPDLGVRSRERPDVPEPVMAVAEFVGYVLWFFAGVVEALVMGIVELVLMAIDMVAVVSLAFYHLFTGDIVDWDCLSAYGQLWQNQPNEAGSLLWNGIVETPDRIADDMLYGRPFDLGREAIGVVMLVDGAGGAARGLTRAGARVRNSMTTPTSRLLAADAALEAEAAATARAAATSDVLASSEVAAGAEALGGETSVASSSELAGSQAGDLAAVAEAAPEPPPVSLSEADAFADLQAQRAGLGHDEGMLANGATNVRGMEDLRYRGSSRRAGGASMSAGDQPTNPQGATVQFGGGGSPHAEGDVANQIIRDIEARVEAGTLTEADLAGRRIEITVEQYPCACCRARHVGARVRSLQAGQTGWMSNLVQMSHWYPDLDLLVRFPGGRVLFRAGEMVERIGIPGAKNIHL